MFKIAGYEPHSMVDYPGMISAVIFTQGCNMNCWYCHNSQLIPHECNYVLEENAILSQLYQNRDLLDSVTITGGEPTLQKDLVPFIMTIKNDIGLKVKLDTNGTNSYIINELIKARVLDYIAMDIKSPYYKHYTKNINLEEIKKTIDLLIENKRNLKVEFRTTVIPSLTYEDIEFIKIHMIYNYGYYFLQQYRKNKPADPEPHPESFIVETAKKLNCKIRGIKTIQI
jgi:pyruvate formate lyase activating enzyme